MKVLMIIALALLVSCGVPLGPDGNLGGETFIGKFHGVSVFRVITPDGVTLYIGIKDGKGQELTQWRSSGKYGHTDYPMITVD